MQSFVRVVLFPLPWNRSVGCTLACTPLRPRGQGLFPLQVFGITCTLSLWPICLLLTYGDLFRCFPSDTQLSLFWLMPSTHWASYTAHPQWSETRGNILAFSFWEIEKKKQQKCICLDFSSTFTFDIKFYILVFSFTKIIYLSPSANQCNLAGSKTIYTIRFFSGILEYIKEGREDSRT